MNIRGMLVLFFLVALSATPALAMSEKPNSEEACRNAFNKSSANRTCDLDSAGPSGGSKCYIDALCQYRDGNFVKKRRTTLSVPPTDVGSLNNCNGWLQIGSC